MIFYWRQLQTFTHQIYGRVGLITLLLKKKKKHRMALWKDIMDSQKQKIFIFQVAEPFIRFFGVYSFTQWHRASPFYLPLLEICFTVSASLVPLATKGGRSGGRTAGIRRAIAPTAPRWIGEGFFQRGSVVAVVKSSQRASLDVKSQVTQQPSLTHGVFCLLEMSGSKNNKLKDVPKMKPEEFHKRIEGLHVQLPNLPTRPAVFP